MRKAALKLAQAGNSDLDFVDNILLNEDPIKLEGFLNYPNGSLATFSLLL